MSSMPSSIREVVLFTNSSSPFLSVIECIIQRWYNETARTTSNDSNHYTGDKIFLNDLTLLIVTLVFPQNMELDFVPFRLSDVSHFWRRLNFAKVALEQKMTVLSNGGTLRADVMSEDCDEEKILFHLHRPQHASNVNIFVVTDFDHTPPQKLLRIDCNGFAFDKNNANFSALLSFVYWKEFDTEANTESNAGKLERFTRGRIISDFYATTECTIECTLNFKNGSLKVENETMGNGFLIYGFPLDILRSCHLKVDLLGMDPSSSRYYNLYYRKGFYATVDINTACNHFRVQTCKKDQK